MSPPQEQDPTVNGLDPFPGRLIAGNFRIERLIGQGAMGNVYQAEQLSLGKAVAVKVLHAHLMDDEKLVGRFKREAKSASKLNHPNSIQIIDSGQDSDGTLYIAMELLAGRDLAQVIRDDFPLPLPRVVRIMTQVMAALDEAHAHGVIHRDLKPSNIMLIERRGERDFVKVCDFGIAKATAADGKDLEEDRQQMLTIQGLVSAASGQLTPLPPGIQASIPTTNAMAGAAPGTTAVIPPVPAAEKYGSTADLTSGGPRARVGIGVLVAALVVGTAAAAFI